MMAVHPFANMFFPSRLDCFCSEYDRIMPQTTNLQYISQLSLPSPSHTPLYFLPFSCTMSLSCATLYIMQELANLFFYFLAVYSSVLDFVLILCKSFYIPPRYTCSESLSQTVPVCLFDMGMCWVSLPRDSPTGGCCSCEWEPLFWDTLLCELW